MSRMGRFLSHRCFHAQTVLLIGLGRPWQNSQPEPCHHKTGMLLGEEGTLKPGVAPAEDHSKNEPIADETEHEAGCPYKMAQDFHYYIVRKSKKIRSEISDVILQYRSAHEFDD